ncbi:MAG: hypothetical protein ACHP93_03590 [Solirubrobacterales bacterium]
MGELIDATLRDDHARASLTINGLTEVARSTLRKLADRDLIRPSLRSR